MPQVYETSTNVDRYVPAKVQSVGPLWPIDVTEGTSATQNGFLGYPLRFIQAALGQVKCERLEDGDWFAEVPECPGVWGKGRNEAECLEDLIRALEEWIRLKLKDGDKDFPILGGVDLNRL